MFRSVTSRWNCNGKGRSIGFECLESRLLLTATPTIYVDVNEDAQNEVLALDAVFANFWNDTPELTYAIKSNTKPDLFSEVLLNENQGKLTLDFAADAYGSGVLIVTGTDADGFSVSVNIDVDVAPVNDAPVITMRARYVGGEFWILSGTVTDVDGDPHGWRVDFTGLTNAYAYVNSDGSYLTELIVAPWQNGLEHAQTEDDMGLESNHASAWIGIT